MKKLMTGMISLALFSCGGLTNGIDVATCDPLVQGAITPKCTGADAVILTCHALTKATAKKFEKADVEKCAADITKAADCAGAKAVTCAIAYTE